MANLSPADSLQTGPYLFHPKYGFYGGHFYQTAAEGLNTRLEKSFSASVMINLLLFSWLLLVSLSAIGKAHCCCSLVATAYKRKQVLAVSLNSEGAQHHLAEADLESQEGC